MTLPQIKTGGAAAQRRLCVSSRQARTRCSADAGGCVVAEVDGDLSQM
jgi:hypothetical protein